MTKRERVKNALNHRKVDKIPKGELAIDAALANRLLGGGYSEAFQDFERELAVRKLLQMDFINIGDWPSEEIGKTPSGDKIFRSNYGEVYTFNGQSKHIIQPPFEDIEDVFEYQIPDISKVSGALIKRFANESDLFVFAQIGEPVSMLNEMIGMEDYMIYAMTNTEEIEMLAEKVMAYEVAKAKLFLDAGADGILIADDIAFNTGLFLPPHIMDEVAWPFYQKAIREIKDYRRGEEIPVVLHTDGNIKKAMTQIVQCGFDGLHSLQPSAGMDIAKIKREYGDELCLIGNIDLDHVLPFGTESEVRTAVLETMKIAGKNSGYMLSTCNILMDSIPEKNVFAMYEAAENMNIEE